jgi:ketosteroid isomerase-like protein
MDDRAAVIDTVTRYATALDARDFAMLEDVFTQDATCDFGAGAVEGRHAVRRMMEQMLGGGGPSQHLLGNLVVEVEGDRARCVSQVRAFSAGAGAAAGRIYELFGEYRDELVRTPEGWRIARREMKVRHEIGDREVLRS